jgi:hypothetical protein
MTNKDMIPHLKRITFFEGQRLEARDLNDWWQTQRYHRWLHNRAFHMWGIAVGLAVRGEAGDSTVTIEPGYGIDSLGRDIILTETQTIPVPAVATGPGGGEAVYYLVARYLEDHKQQVVEQRQGVCLPDGSVRLTEAPALDWKQRDQLDEGVELIVAQAWVQNCQLSRPLSWAVRRNARPSQQPYIASGQTPIGGTAWEPWEVEGQPMGLFTVVDISSARFRTTPQIMARIGVQEFPEQPPIVTPGQATIVDVTPQRFEFQIQIDTPDMASSWYVVWVGIESGAAL